MDTSIKANAKELEYWGDLNLSREDLDILKNRIMLLLERGFTFKNLFKQYSYAMVSYVIFLTSDISGCITGKCQIVLYDDTPGGSGFVKYVYERLEDVIIKAKEKVNGNCGCTEETSCYGCLRNYGNQFYHDILSRGVAYKYLDWLLNAID